MARQTSKSDIIELRRRRVASMLLRNMSQREIVQALAQESKLQILNPDTGKPYSIRTINADIQALRKKWREEYRADFLEHVSTELARLEELERAAWNTSNLELVLQIIKQRSQILGLNAPQKIQIEEKWIMEAVILIGEGKLEFEILEQAIGYSQAREIFISAGKPEQVKEQPTIIEYQPDKLQTILSQRYRDGEITEDDLKEIIGDDEIIQRIIES